MFKKFVDRRSAKAMVHYLTKHFRYDTMNSWNASTSYANRVKLHYLEGIDFNKAYDIIGTPEWGWIVDDYFTQFAEHHNWQYQLSFNGKSGGYIVLLNGGKKQSGYKSWCKFCGQLNFTAVEENSTKCGKCNKNGRVNFERTHMRIFTMPGQSIDQHEDFTEWEIEDLRERTRLVMDLDRTCDDLLKELQHLCNTAKIVEKTRYRPEKYKVLELAA